MRPTTNRVQCPRLQHFDDPHEPHTGYTLRAPTRYCTGITSPCSRGAPCPLFTSRGTPIHLWHSPGHALRSACERPRGLGTTGDRRSDRSQARSTIARSALKPCAHLRTLPRPSTRRPDTRQHHLNLNIEPSRRPNPSNLRNRSGAGLSNGTWIQLK